MVRGFDEPDNRTFPDFGALVPRLRPEVLEHGFTHGNKWWRFRSQRNPYNRLYFFLKGEAKVGHEGRWFPLRPGTIILLRSGQPWDLHAEKAFEKFYLHFRLELLPGVDLFDGLPRPDPVFLEWRGLDAMVEKLRNASVLDLLEFNGTLCEMLARLARKGGVRPPEDLARQLTVRATFHDFFEMCRVGPYDAIELSAVARRLGMSLSAFSRSFRRETRLTPTQWMHLRFARRAEDLLLLTNKKVREIARELGFRDEYYFSRFFRKNLGSSPRAFREENRTPYSPGTGSP